MWGGGGGGGGFTQKNRKSFPGKKWGKMGKEKLTFKEKL